MMNPYILEERQLNVTQIDIFSRLMLDRIIFIGDTITSELANIVQAQLLFLNSVNNKEISIYINSPGGEVYAGLGIYDTMQYIKCPIKTICTGMAASMAAVLLAAGDVRCALPHSKIMIHQPSGFAGGQSSDIEIEAKEMAKTKKDLYELLSKHTGQTYDKIYKDCDRDYWMTSEEAKNYGLIDNILIHE